MRNQRITVPKHYISRPYHIAASPEWHIKLSIIKEKLGCKTKGNILKEAVEKMYKNYFAE